MSEPVENQRASCSACHQVWPVNMLVRVDERFLCHLCKERALGDTQRYQMRQGVDPERLRFWGIVLTVVAVAGFAGFRMFLRSSARVQNPAAASSGTGLTQSEPWADKEPGEWPAVLLTNQIESSTPQWRVAPNAFLIQRVDGGIVAATVMIGEPRSSSSAETEASATAPTPPMPPFALTSWKLAIASEGAKNGKGVIAAGKILPGAEALLERGILLANLDSSSGEFPVTPLKVRATGYGSNVRMKILAANGSAGGAPKVYAVSVRNNDSGDDTRILTVEKNLVSGRQRVIGVSGDGSDSLFELEEKVRVEDLVGAPVIDAFGHVAAIVTGPDHGGARDGMARRVRGFGMDALREAMGGVTK